MEPLYCAKNVRRNREIPGNITGLVGLYQKKNYDGRLNDHKIKQKFLEEDRTIMVKNFLTEDKLNVVIHEFDRVTDKRSKKKLAGAEVGLIMEHRKADLDARRTMLYKLLIEEEQCLLKGIEAMQLTPEQKKEQILYKLSELKSDREKERQEFVQEQRDKQFRKNTPILRQIISKKIQNEVANERCEQIILKNKLLDEQKQRDKMYHDLYMEDATARRLFEEQSLHEARKKNIENQDFIQTQITELNQKRMERKRLIQEEADLMTEQRRIMKIENQWEYARKAQKQKQIKGGLDRELRKKLTRIHKEAKEEFELDKYYLSQIVGNFLEKEIQEREIRKKELWNEQESYKDALRNHLNMVKKQEQDIEKQFKLENDAMWDKREQEWSRWQYSRERLLTDCLSGTYDLIQQRLAQNQKEQIAKAEESKNITKHIEENMKKFLAEKEEIRCKKETYKGQLIDQMGYNNNKRANDMVELHREWAECRKQEEMFQAQIQKEIDTVFSQDVHPYRKIKLKEKSSIKECLTDNCQ